MRLIEDLGRKEYGTQGQKTRFGLYECPGCLKHFTCRTSDVMSGNTSRCSTCAIKARAETKIKTAGSLFKDRASSVHNGAYDYSKVVYEGAHTKVIIVCKIHGEFLQTPDHHINGNGCPECSGRSQECAKLNFIPKASEVHNNKYDYSMVEYIHNKAKVAIVCKLHGKFDQTPSDHLRGKGCPKCANERAGSILKAKAKASFSERAYAVHGGIYNYDLVDYVHAHHAVTIVCNIHGEFKQTPANHTSGKGCPKCSGSGGFDKTKRAIMYYIKVFNKGVTAYKIGITNRTVEERFTNGDLCNISVLHIWEYELGNDALEREQQILKQYKDYKYTGEPLLSSGNTELFTSDILGLDNDQL